MATAPWTGTSISTIVSSVPVIDISFDALLKENSSGLVYWAANYVMKVTQDTNNVVDPPSNLPDWVDVQIVSGQYYDPIYGYVNVITTVDFRFLESDNYAWPTSGILVGTGTTPQGALFPNKVQLEALNANQCRITADYNGDGLLDDYTGPDPIDWTSL